MQDVAPASDPLKPYDVSDMRCQRLNSVANDAVEFAAQAELAEAQARLFSIPRNVTGGCAKRQTRFVRSASIVIANNNRVSVLSAFSFDPPSNGFTMC